MKLIPQSKAGKIEFCEAHVTPWTTYATEIGSSAPAVTAWSAKVTAARAAYQAQKAAQQAARAATNELNLALMALMDATSDIVRQIRTQAALSGDAVYSLAEIPPPALPAPVGPPGTPTALKVTLKPDGSLGMSWTSSNPPGCNGVVYQVYRKTDPAAEWAYVGGAGLRKWTDQTLPAGVAMVMYKIVGVRSTAMGDSGEFIVNFGTGSGGAMAAQVSAVTPGKLAA